MAAMEIIIYFGIFFGLYFSVFMLITFFENKKAIYKNPGVFYSPKVAVIVPAFNEEKNIERTLDSLVNLDYPKENLEIIVVDDGSADKTFEKACLFASINPQVKVFKKENGGKHTAMNLGISQTKAEFIASVDADSFLDKEAFKKIMPYFENPETKAVVSTIKIAEAKNAIERIQFVEFLIAAFLRKIFSVLQGINVTPGPLSVFRREVFEKIGLYRKAHQTEDLEFAFRMQNSNFKIAHAHEAMVYTDACKNFWRLNRQRLRWRRGFLLNLKDYPQLLNFKKHGNLSFILLFNVLGSFVSVSIVSYSLYRLGLFVAEKINQLFLVDFDLSQFSFNFDPGTMALKPTMFLGVISLSAFLSYIFYSKKMTNEKKSLKKDSVFYIIFYAFLNSLWWITAIYSAFFKKDIKWVKS